MNTDEQYESKEIHYDQNEPVVKTHYYTPSGKDGYGNDFSDEEYETYRIDDSSAEGFLPVLPGKPASF